MALLFAAVSSAAIYTEVQAADIIQSSDYVVVPQYSDAVQLPVPEARVVAATDIPVITNLNDLQQIIYEEMQNFTTTFQVQYKGDTKELNSNSDVFSKIMSDTKRLNHKIEVEEGVMKEECSKILSTFFKQKRI